jgi:hypothetical protein
MLRKLAVMVALSASSSAGAYTSDYHLNFGPYVGGGDISDGATVRHTSGYTLAVERNWAVGTSGLSVGPRIEVSNGFVNTRNKDAASGVTSVATYDNRIFAAGVRVSQNVGAPHTFAQGIYLTAVAGKAYSKLAIDDTGADSFIQRSYGNISGNFFGSELGGWIPLKDNFGINLAVLGSSYRANQSDATGSFEGEVQNDNGLSLTSGSYDGTADNKLADSVVMKTVAGRIGLSLGF